MKRLIFLAVALMAVSGFTRSSFENNAWEKGIELKMERERIALERERMKMRKSGMDTQGDTYTHTQTVYLEDLTSKGDILRMTNGDLFSVFMQDQPTASLLLPTTRLQVIPTGGHFVLVDPFGKLIHAKIMDPE